MSGLITVCLLSINDAHIFFFFIILIEFASGLAENAMFWDSKDPRLLSDISTLRGHDHVNNH